MNSRISLKNQDRQLSFLPIFFFMMALYVTLMIVFDFAYHHYFIETSDFKALYTGALMVKNGAKEKLYDFQTQYIIQHAVAPKEPKQNFLFFNYPPFLALFFAPFSFFNVKTAFHMWNTVNIILLVIVCKNILEEIGVVKKSTSYCLIVFIFLSPLVLITLLNGQLSVVLLFSVVMGWRSFISGRYFKTGLWLSFLCLKPQYLIVPALIFIWKKYTRLVWGMIAGSFIFLLLSVGTVGLKGLSAYGLLLTSIPSARGLYRLNPTHQGNIWSFVHFLFWKTNGTESLILSALIAFGLLYLFYSSWKKIEDTKYDKDLFYAELVLLTLLISIHTNPYDLVMLFVPLTIIFIRVVNNKIHFLYKQHSLLRLRYFSFFYLWIMCSVFYSFLAILAILPELLILPVSGLLLYGFLSEKRIFLSGRNIFII